MYYDFITFIIKSVVTLLLCTFIYNIYLTVPGVTTGELTICVSSITYITMIMSEFYFKHAITGFEFVIIQIFYWYLISSIYYLNTKTTDEDK